MNEKIKERIKKICQLIREKRILEEELSSLDDYAKQIKKTKNKYEKRKRKK